MRFSIRWLVATSLLASLVAAPTFALEKSVRRFTDSERPDVWRGGTTCSLVYYNTCTDWIWVWSGWTPADRFGVAFDSCCPLSSQTSVGTTFFYIYTGVPSGYGFTGSLDVWDADANGCPTGSSLASTAWLPVTGWNSYNFLGTVVPDGTFAISYTTGATSGSPLAIATDHPDAGPTGGVACGTCYPIDRVNHTFYWGTPTTPTCPGSPLNDGVCDAQFIWDVSVGCAVAVEPTTWGSVKNLYR
jgi:hypothetical protein